MRYVVIPTGRLCQIADAYADREDAIEAALRGGGDCTLLEIIGEATSGGHNVYKEFPHTTTTDTEKTDDNSGN